MPLLKNVWFTPLDVGGQLLAQGETANLDPSAPDIAGHIAGERLATVAPAPDAKRVSKPATPEES